MQIKLQHIEIEKERVEAEKERFYKRFEINGL